MFFTFAYNFRMNLQTLLAELAAAGYGDTDISKGMREIAGLTVAPSIVQRLRVGRHKQTTWARTNGFLLVHKEMLRRKTCASTVTATPPATNVTVIGTGMVLLRHIDPQVAADFLAQRKDKRRPLTATALRAIEIQAKKAGLTLEQALRVCCENGWMGFRANWYERLLRGESRQKFSGASFVLRDVKM